MSNSYGNYRTTRAASMAAYDRLPPPLRHAVQVAVSSWAAKPLLDMHNAGFRHSEIVRLIVQGDREQTIIDYGPQHPEAGHD